MVAKLHGISTSGVYQKKEYMSGMKIITSKHIENILYMIMN